MARGSMDVSLKGYAEAVKKLKTINKNSEAVVQRTISDFKSKAPAWISKAVRDEYNISVGDMSKAGKAAKKGAKTAGRYRIAGITVDNVQLTYTGRLLTPAHFGMKPKKPPAGRGEKKSRKYILTAEIHKGKRVTLGRYLDTRTPGGPYSQRSHNILMPTGSTKEGATSHIPFQRQSPRRGDVEKMTTTSIPQMLTHEKVAEQIQKNIDEGLTKRLHHHLDQLSK